MTSDTIPNTGGAVDLDQVARANAKEVLDRRDEERRQAFESIAEHDRRMQRIFKGIIARPQRRRMLVVALDRMAEGYTPPKRHNYKTRADAPRKRRGPGGGGKRKAVKL